VYSRKNLISASSAVVGLALIAVALFLIPRRAERAAAPRKAVADYVDAPVCAGCHTDIARSFRSTGMARSLYRLRPDNVVEDFRTHNRIYNRASDRYYEMTEHDGRWFERRHQIGFDGKETNVEEKPIDYVIGSGNHVRSYLSRTSSGRMVELPVSWYTEQGGYWAMSPGYDRPDQLDFRRAVVTECIACHNRYLPSDQLSHEDANVPVFAADIAEGIDCQRCHGPGRAHVEAAGSARASKAEIRQAIVNPARLPRDRQLEVCMQCHLETTSSPLPHVLAKFDRQPFTWRPGESLSDAFLFFDRADASSHDSFQIAHAAYRLRQSKCFLSSDMTCTTCHDPHKAPRGEEAAQHYNAVCSNCHSSAHIDGKLAAGNCVDCHMPKRRTEDAVHVVMTDHYIQRRKPSGDLLAPAREKASKQEEYRGEVSLYYPPQLPKAPDSALYLDVAQVRDGSNLKSGIARLESDVQKIAPSGPEFYLELGEAYAKTGDLSQAIHWYEEALRRQPDHRPTLVELGLELAGTGQLARAAETLEKAAALPPKDPVVVANLGGVYLKLGNLERAEEYLKQAIALDPDSPEAHNLRGLLLGQKGDWAGAESELRAAITTQPDLAEAHYNLARALAATQRFPESRYEFEKTISIQPEYAEAHHNYGLLLAAAGSLDGAVAQYYLAIRLEPNRAETHSDLAEALSARGKISDAAAEYRQALKLDSNSPAANFGLGMILSRQGHSAEAREFLEKAAAGPDPDVRAAAEHALR
jgi:predicted CXXCH cytochrome family protein